MSRGLINSVKQRLSHPLSRIKSIDQWAVDPDPFLTLTTSAKIGKTAIQFSMTNSEKSLYHARIWTRPRGSPTLEGETVIVTTSKVLGLNPRDPLASEAHDIDSKPMRSRFSQFVPVSVHQERIRGLWLSSQFLADVVKVKKGSGSTAHWSIDFMRLSGWLRRCFTLLINPLDIDGICENWKDSNSNIHSWHVIILTW